MMTFGHDISSVRCFAISVANGAYRMRQLCESLRAKNETMTEDNHSACVNILNEILSAVNNLAFVISDARESEKARDTQEVTAE